ncbi:unnamed protein product [Mucor hiemalis]
MTMSSRSGEVFWRLYSQKTRSILNSRHIVIFILTPLKLDFIYYRGESFSAACEEDYRVDARIVIQVNNAENDLGNMKASRETTNQKIDDDHLKLIIESKCALDNIIKKTSSIDLASGTHSM